MRNQTKLHLQQLQLAMQKLDLWQAVPPSQDAFLSEEPFAIDTMSPEEWLQWIFIPRMFALLESGVELPSKIAVVQLQGLSLRTPLLLPEGRGGGHPLCHVPAGGHGPAVPSGKRHEGGGLWPGNGLSKGRAVSALL